MNTGDERGVSTVLGYTLSLGITTILIAGLLISVGGLVDAQRERATRSELEVLGQTLAAELTAADRLVTAGTDSASRGSLRTASIGYDMPATIGGASYRITLRSGEATPKLELETRDPSVTVTVAVATVTPVSDSSASGGSVRIQYCTDETAVQCDGHIGTLVIGNG